MRCFALIIPLVLGACVSGQSRAETMEPENYRAAVAVENSSDRNVEIYCYQGFTRHFVGQVGPGRSATLVLPSGDCSVRQAQHRTGGLVNVRRVNLPATE